MASAHGHSLLLVVLCAWDAANEAVVSLSSGNMESNYQRVDSPSHAFPPQQTASRVATVCNNADLNRHKALSNLCAQSLSDRRLTVGSPTRLRRQSMKLSPSCANAPSPD